MTFVATILLITGGVLILSGIEGKTIADTVSQLLGGAFYVKPTTKQS